MRAMQHGGKTRKTTSCIIEKKTHTFIDKKTWWHGHPTRSRNLRHPSCCVASALCASSYCRDDLDVDDHDHDHNDKYDEEEEEFEEGRKCVVQQLVSNLVSFQSNLGSLEVQHNRPTSSFWNHPQGLVMVNVCKCPNLTSPSWVS